MTDQAYRGHLIRFSPFRDDCWIERGGTVILASVSTLREAKREIDTILNGTS